MAECRVEKCGAISCKHNKSNKCTLDEVNVLFNGVCQQFLPVDWQKHMKKE